MLIHPSSGAFDLFDELFHELCCSGSMCVGVTLWFVCGGVSLYSFQYENVVELAPDYGQIKALN